MDHSIKLVSAEMQFERGVVAHAHGRGVDDHYMNPGSPAIKDWQAGWRFAEQRARSVAIMKPMEVA
jgi:hypothetical protein